MALMELDLDLSMAMKKNKDPSTSEVGLLLLHCIVRSRARNTILSELVLMLSPSVKEADSIHVPVMEHGYWLIIGSYLDSNDQELTDTSRFHWTEWHSGLQHQEEVSINLAMKTHYIS